jgi:D-alanyl-lipoteichoic acid acyltransferase DltB (MBOAT superfamily)
MNILSVEFAVFAAAVALVSGWAPRQTRPWILGVASLAFYALSDPSHLWVLVALVALVYGFARGLERAAGRLRVAILATGVVAVLGTLGAYRYLNFAGGYFLAVVGSPVPPYASSPTPVMPLGLSFYCLRLVAYLIDVHRGTVSAERHIGRFCGFVALFLEIGSGPIERARSLLPQLDETPAFDYNRVTSGLIRIAMGVFKKAVVADYLALPVGRVYGHPADYSGPVLLFATVAFALQIYLDFSGYADIAIGAGQVLGLRLSENFARPYFGRTVAEFWNRWHMTLSNWLRDYCFLPVAFAADRRLDVSWLRPRTATVLSYSVAVVPTMLAAGWWHGAGWTFLVWGGLNGVFMAAGRLTAPWRSRMWRAAGFAPVAIVRRVAAVMSTFALVCVAWVFFRSATLGDAFTVLSGIATWRPAPGGPGWLPGGVATLRIGPWRATICGAFLAAVLFVDLAGELSKTDTVTLLRRQRLIIRWGCYYALVVSIFLFGIFGQSQFIYFQF